MTRKFNHVAVLMGGWSAERPVSLNSGQACADALGFAARIEVSNYALEIEFGGTRILFQPRFTYTDPARVVEQPLLAPETSRVAGEGAVGADDAVAGQDDGAAVQPVGVGDGAHRGRTSDALGHLLIGASNSRRDFP